MGAGNRDEHTRRPTHDVTESGRDDDRLHGLLPDEVAVELDLAEVESRRRRLYVVGGILILGAATITTLVLTVDQVELPWWAGWALLATTALFLADATQQERALSQVTRTLVAQEQRTAELEATVSDLGGLLGVARRINAVLLPEEVYDVVLAAAVDLLEADSGSIRLRAGGMLAVAASTGADAPRVGSAVVVEDDPAVVVVTLGVDIVEDDPPRLALPITVGERHVGVLEVRRDGADAMPFTTRSALLARLFAEEAAAAVVNANRFDVERSRAEELRSDREVRTDAIADTVHDLRVPLSGLVAYAELLKDRFDQLGDARRGEAVEGVWNSAQQLKQLVDQVFEAASAEAQAIRVREPIELAPLVRSVAANAEATSAVEGGQVELKLDGDPVVLGDPEALQRVLDNLVHNALEHGSQTVRVRLQDQGREVRIHIADRGPGIADEELTTLFQRRRREGGSPRGRGLAIVDALVRAMGGRVGVRSQEGVGSVFTVVLPAADPTD